MADPITGTFETLGTLEIFRSFEDFEEEAIEVIAPAIMPVSEAQRKRDLFTAKKLRQQPLRNDCKGLTREILSYAGIGSTRVTRKVVGAAIKVIAERHATNKNIKERLEGNEPLNILLDMFETLGVTDEWRRVDLAQQTAARVLRCLETDYHNRDKKSDLSRTLRVKKASPPAHVLRANAHAIEQMESAWWVGPDPDPDDLIDETIDDDQPAAESPMSADAPTQDGDNEVSMEGQADALDSDVEDDEDDYVECSMEELAAEAAEFGFTIYPSINALGTDYARAIL